MQSRNLYNCLYKTRSRNFHDNDVLKGQIYNNLDYKRPDITNYQTETTKETSKMITSS